MVKTKIPKQNQFRLLEEPDIYAATYDFIEATAVPKFPKTPNTGRIFRGGQNRLALPKDNEYAFMQIISTERHGTNVEVFNGSVSSRCEDGIETIGELISLVMQIDFYSDANGKNAQNARIRAQNIELASRSGFASKFYKQYGIGCFYASMPKRLSFLTPQQQYAERWEVELTLCYWNKVEYGMPWFDRVNVHVKNADTFSPHF